MGDYRLPFAVSEPLIFPYQDGLPISQLDVGSHLLFLLSRDDLRPAQIQGAAMGLGGICESTYIECLLYPKRDESTGLTLGYPHNPQSKREQKRMSFAARELPARAREINKNGLPKRACIGSVVEYFSRSARG